MTNSRAGLSANRDELTSTFTTTSTTKTIVTGLTQLTGTGLSIIMAQLTVSNDTGTIPIYFDLFDGSAIIDSTSLRELTANYTMSTTLIGITNSVKTVIVRTATTSNTVAVEFLATSNVERDSSMTVLIT